MKKIYVKLLTFGLAAISAVSVQAQTENVGIGTTSPDNSAVLDIQSPNKGLLIPRMSMEERNSINNPANGLMIYQTGKETGFYFYNGTKWKPINENDAKSVALDVANWSKTGDAGTNPTTNFLGTTDNQPLRFRVNNQSSGTIDHIKGNMYLGFGSGNINTSTGNFNVGIGNNSLSALTLGTENVAIGMNSLNANTIGKYNVALGGAALNFAQSDDNNVAIGWAALNKNNGGAGNIAIGAVALSQHVTGSNNMAIGYGALSNNIGGNTNLAIGLNAGGQSVGNGNVFIGADAGYFEAGNNKLYISGPTSSVQNPLLKGDFSSNNLQVNSKTNGYLAIGDFTNAPSGTPGLGGLPLPANIGQAGGYRLVVQDGILCEKVKVALRATGSSDWADYVFEPEYKSKMMSLEEIETFTMINKHLPNVPSLTEVQKNGLDFQETSKMFMEKIEELTLYMIEMNKEIKALKAERDLLKK